MIPFKPLLADCCIPLLYVQLFSAVHFSDKTMQYRKEDIVVAYCEIDMLRITRKPGGTENNSIKDEKLII